MSAREQFFEDMQGDNRHAALLVAQVGGMPSEIQLITQVAEYDEDAGGLRPIRTYIIRVLGAEEHRITGLGVTSSSAALVTDHPLLYQYNHTPAAVFFKGTPDDTSEIVLDIAQAHASTFKNWRQFPQYLNVEQPLETLFRSGGGLLGQMPEPLVAPIVRVLDKHGLENRVMQGESKKPDHPGMNEQRMSALIIGTSYFLSYAFSFEEMKGRGNSASS